MHVAPGSTKGKERTPWSIETSNGYEMGQAGTIERDVRVDGGSTKGKEQTPWLIGTSTGHKMEQAGTIDRDVRVDVKPNVM